MRGALAAARRGARTAKACQGVAEAEHMAIEASLVQSVKNLARIDPTYPADYALGVAAYRHGDYADSAAAFRRWLEAHRDGPLAIRAQNYLRAASGAEHVE
jgi:TolA-binding protein